MANKGKNKGKYFEFTGLGSSTSYSSVIKSTLRPAIVLDIVLDSNHPIFSNSNAYTSIDADNWPADLNGKQANPDDVDYTWIGRILIRLLDDDSGVEKDKLIWAYPAERSVSEYPLINETVIVWAEGSQFFYTRKVNIKNFINEAVDFSLNDLQGNGKNTELYTNNVYEGVTSYTRYNGGYQHEGVVGKYFKVNDNIRSIKRHEGDLAVESRFGQSIRFSSYDDDRRNDSGDKKNQSYFPGGGNPTIIIRNRQRNLLSENEQLRLNNSPNFATIRGTKEEKNAGGFIKENINHDGSSIYLSTGQTITEWVTTCYKKMFGVREEVPAFSGKTDYVYPVLNGDQIIINSDRLILSSRYGEIFNYAKKRCSTVTDGEYTVDSHNQMIFTTHNKTVFNSPAIYLGEYDNTNEPALLGQTTVNWLYDLCNWLLEHVHIYHHSHVDAGPESPSKTQQPAQLQQLIILRDKLHTLMSRRVFLTGGGLAPGQNGASIPNGSFPTNIDVIGGAGVPGGWKGSNRR